jgi:hypothetical protein
MNLYKQLIKINYTHVYVLNISGDFYTKWKDRRAVCYPFSKLGKMWRILKILPSERRSGPLICSWEFRRSILTTQRPAILSEAVRDFRQFLQRTLLYHLKTVHCRFPSHPSQFIIHNHPPIWRYVACVVEKAPLHKQRNNNSSQIIVPTKMTT